jgi:hypothetical protein
MRQVPIRLLGQRYLCLDSYVLIARIPESQQEAWAGFLSQKQRRRSLVRARQSKQSLSAAPPTYARQALLPVPAWLRTLSKIVQTRRLAIPARSYGSARPSAAVG